MSASATLPSQCNPPHLIDHVPYIEGDIEAILRDTSALHMSNKCAKLPARPRRIDNPKAWAAQDVLLDGDVRLNGYGKENIP
jgi:hypothetical protein